LPDLSVPWEGDLIIGPNGDFVTVSGPTQTKERIIRRLLTNPLAQDNNGQVTGQCDYVFHPQYGAGARRLVHTVITPELTQTVQQRVTEQALQEPSVVANPAPVVNVKQTPDNLGLAIDAAVATVAGGLVVIPTIQVTP